MKWLLLFAGGGIGAVGRFALALWVDERTSLQFPWGTLAVNAIGCLAIGLLATLADVRGVIPPGLRLFLVAGLLGGFTTFSTFGLETWRMLEAGRWPGAVVYALSSVGVGLLAVVVGVVLARSLGR
ncbi:MAG: fluoride efflux transporter CrcB [Myxococcota bacterium]